MSFKFLDEYQEAVERFIKHSADEELQVSVTNELNQVFI